jgi:DNA-directed RNA polymerase subunit RPC12/RpoP
MTEQSLPPGFTDHDILFECPKCGKSLGIDERGAGLIVTCPDCGQRMQVPTPEELEASFPGSSTAVPTGTESDETRALKAKVERLQVTMEEVLDRKRYLEKMRIDHALRFERIREEMAIIQAALDRMTDILQDLPLGKDER